jgi:hypothetical protein
MEVVVFHPKRQRKVDSPEVRPNLATMNPEFPEELANWLASIMEEKVKSLTLEMEVNVKSLIFAMDEKAKIQVALEEKVSLLTKTVESLQKELVELKNVKQTTKVPETSKSFKDVLKTSIKANTPVPTTMTEEEWTEVKSKPKVESTAKSAQIPKTSASRPPTKSLKSFLDRSPSKEEILKALVRSPKKPEERHSNVISIFAKVPLTLKAIQEPILAWKQILKEKVGDLPLSISLVNPCTAELFYEENSLHRVLPILKAENYLMDQTNHMISEKDMNRRTDAYLRGYFRPLRLAALVGFNPECQKKLLLMAKERLEKRFEDKFSRQQWRHHIQKDMEHVLEVESAQMSEI